MVEARHNADKHYLFNSGRLRKVSAHIKVDCFFVCRTLKAAGARGMHTVLLASHINMVALHIQLGFEDVTDKNAPDDMLVLGMKL